MTPPGDSMTPLGDSMAENPQLLAGRYEFVRFVARGGMSSVYLARDVRLDRPVAVKVLFAGLADNPSFVERFRREALAAARLNHPRIVRVYDSGQDSGTYFIVMEYIEGQTLSKVLKQEGALTVPTALRIGEDVAEALADAHKQNVIHRDVKPGNIMFTPSSGLKVTDFGIARAVTGSISDLTQTGTVMGTATYFSPEQAKGDPADYRTDIYSLGVVLFEMLAGKPPFYGDSPIAVAYQHVNEPPPTLHDVTDGAIPPELSNVVARLLAKRPEDRYQDAELLRQDLASIRTGRPSRAAALPAGAAAAGAATGLATEYSGKSSKKPPRRRESRQRAATAASRSSAPPVPAASHSAAPPAPPGASLPAPPGASHPGAPAPPAEPPRYPPYTPPYPPSRPSEPPPPRRRITETEIIAARQRRRTALFWASFALILALLAGIITFISLSTDDNSNDTAEAPRIDLPSMVRNEEPVAVNRLDELGFTWRLEYEENAQVPSGQVIRQNPRAGARLPEDSEVTLTISLGAEALSVPDVVEWDVEDARRLLESDEYGFDVILQQIDSSSPVGQVISQSPEPGEQRQSGTEIILNVSSGQQAVPVPDVVGQPRAVAQASIIQAGLRYEERRVPHETVPADQVIQTDPVAGTEIRTDADTAVVVFISTGSDPTRTVPYIIDLTEAEARDELEESGFIVAVIYQQVLLPENVGRVIAQDPAPATSLSLDLFPTVTITVGSDQEDLDPTVSLRPALDS